MYQTLFTLHLLHNFHTSIDNDLVFHFPMLPFYCSTGWNPPCQFILDSLKKLIFTMKCNKLVSVITYPYTEHTHTFYGFFSKHTISLSNITYPYNIYACKRKYNRNEIQVIRLENGTRNSFSVQNVLHTFPLKRCHSITSVCLLQRVSYKELPYLM